MKKFAFLFLLITFITTGCDNNDPDISKINTPDVCINRYDKDLFSINPDNIGHGLGKLAEKYYIFIGDNYRDTLNIIQIGQYITDPLLNELNTKTQDVYPKLDFLGIELTRAFKYYKFYFPDKIVPDVYSYISGVDAEYPVAILDTSMIIGIDCYLGKDYLIYKQMRIPAYRAKRMQAEYIKTSAMEALGRNEFTARRTGDQLIDKIIEEGKILYYLDKVFPEVNDTLKIGYTAKQLDWCDDNEAHIWAFLMENELLFSSDLQKISKLIQDGPFTSYFSNESPGRIGHWIGWQIVRSYMDNNNTSIEELMNLRDNQYILNNSRYKP